MIAPSSEPTPFRETSETDAAACFARCRSDVRHSPCYVRVLAFCQAVVLRSSDDAFRYFLYICFIVWQVDRVTITSCTAPIRVFVRRVMPY